MVENVNSVLHCVVESTISGNFNEDAWNKTVLDVYESAGVASPGKDDDDGDEGDVDIMVQLSFVFQVFKLHDDVDKHLSGTPRKDEQALQELRSRVEMMYEGMQLLMKKGGATAAEDLKKWSSLYEKSLDVKRGDMLVASFSPGSKAALTSLRKIEVDTAIKNFVESEIGLVESKSAAPEFLAAAKTYRGVLPERCGALVDQALAYEKTKHVVSQLQKNESVTILDVVRTHSEATQHLMDLCENGTTEVKNAVEYLTTKKTRC